MYVRLIWFSSALFLFLHDCGSTSRFAPSSADPTKGTVTGTVICADTGKPARFANVELVRSANPGSNEKSGDTETAVTGLDGKFKMEGVAPGNYYAFATLAGYLDPAYGIEFDRIDAGATDDQMNAEMIEQWKEHMVEVSVTAQRTSDLAVTLERGAEINGTVAYDDGSPAAGLRFALYRKNSKGGWMPVGLSSADSFSLDEKSGARGRYDIANLTAGEYIVCSLLPADNQANSPQVCLGDTFRKRDAKTLTLEPGDVANEVDITVPLGAIHSVSGSIVHGVENQPVSRAMVHLLYADDREEAMAMDMFADGTFLLPFVPEGNYILRMTDASWTEPGSPANPGDKSAPKTHPLAVREVPLTVDQDVKDLKIGLVAAPEPKSAAGTEGQVTSSPQ